MGVSKTMIRLALETSYKNNSFEYLGLCDGGKEGQVVYVQVYNTPAIAKGRNYAFYGYDRYKAGEVDGQIVWDSHDEETWREVYFDKASAIDFAREILREI